MAATSATFGVGTDRRVASCRRDSQRRSLRAALRRACRRARPTSRCSRQALEALGVPNAEQRWLALESKSKTWAHNRRGELEGGDLLERGAQCPYANRAIRPASCHEDALLWRHAVSISTTQLIRRLFARRWSFGAFRRRQKRKC